jgi:putative transposase
MLIDAQRTNSVPIGMSINPKAVARIMRKMACRCGPYAAFVETTDSDHESPIFPDLAAGTIPNGPNQLWVAT